MNPGVVLHFKKIQNVNYLNMNFILIFSPFEWVALVVNKPSRSWRMEYCKGLYLDKSPVSLERARQDRKFVRVAH